MKACRRAATLYAVHLAATLTTLAIFAGGAVWFAQPELLTQINIEKVMTATPEAMIGLVTLGHQLGYNNILPLYAVLLLMTPLLLLGAARFGLGVVLAGSAILWLASGVFAVAPPNYPGDGVWFLNPLSWQLLFAIGMIAALYFKGGGRLPTHPLLLTACAIYLLISFLWVRIPLWHLDISGGLPSVLTGFDKTYLSAPRMLHVLAAAYLIASLPAIGNLAATDRRHPLAVLGRHSLPVFVAGTLLAMVGQVLKEVVPDSLALDTALITTGLLIQFLVAYACEWAAAMRQNKSPGKPVPSVPALARASVARSGSDLA